ncbi:MAG: YARHG domain-containing protein [Fusobacteriaceae bacterium]|jgi:hypothetical protein|nr:YARHG domain-containing protein [Fusobacteriaceae bacterium]
MKKVLLLLFVHATLFVHSLANSTNTLNFPKDKIQNIPNITIYKEKIKTLNLSYTDKILSLLTYEGKSKNQASSFTYNLTRQGLSMINKINTSDIETIKNNLELSKNITDRLKSFYDELYILQPPEDLKIHHTELINGLSASIGFYIDVNTILNLAANSNDAKSNINYLMKNFYATVKNTDLYQYGYSAIEESDAIEIYKGKVKNIDTYLANALTQFITLIQNIETNDPKIINSNLAALRKITVVLKISFDDLADITPPEELKSAHQKLKSGVFACLNLFIEVTNIMDLASKSNDPNLTNVSQRFKNLQNNFKSIEKTLDLYRIGYGEVMGTTSPVKPPTLAISTDIKIVDPIIATDTNIIEPIIDTNVDTNIVVKIVEPIIDTKIENPTPEKTIIDSDTYYDPTKSSDVFTYTGNYLLPSDKEYIKYTDLNSYSRAEVALIRNEIFARRGYKFTSKKYGTYFNSKNWYSPSGFNAKSLNNIERINIQTLLRYEKNKGWK